MVDVSGMEGRDPIDDFNKINKELEAYSAKLAKRTQLVVANKMDMPDSPANFEKLKAYVEGQGYEIMAVSAVTGAGLKELMSKAFNLVQAYVPEPETEEIPTLGAGEELDQDKFEVIKGNDTDFEVKGKAIERLVAMTNFNNDEALYRFQLIWKRLQIEEALKAAGIKEGQTVRILDMVFNYKEGNAV